MCKDDAGGEEEQFGMNKHENLYNKLFTQKVFEVLMAKKGHAVYQALAEADLKQPHLLSNGEIIHNLYTRMSKSYRNEYIYQNTLLNALLLGKHSVRTTAALSQVPVGKAVADFIPISAKQKKEPVADASALSHQSMFKLLRKREYEHIVHSYFGFLSIDYLLIV